MLLELGKSRIQVRELEVAAALIVRAFRYNIIALIDHPLAGAQRDAFIEELSDLIGTYLLAPRPWREQSSATK